ncbi:site-specific DNA-methyltransferase [Arthrospira platensis BEA 1257B]
MAIGIPKKDKLLDDNQVELVYAHKKSYQEIINSDLVEYQSIYSHASPKRLYFGDNLDVLRLLATEPEICGSINLIYIDPPFATESHFLSRKQSKAYDDTLTGAMFVEFLRERLIWLHQLLSNHGSIYLHLDEKMIFHIKLIMDEIFGAENYRNMIVRQKCNPKNYTRRTYGKTADFILFYTKSDTYIWNQPKVPLSENSKKEYQYIEPETGRQFMKVPLHAPGVRHGETGKPWRGKMPPPGKHWQYPPKTLDEMDARGEIFWSKNGNPRRKVYLNEHSGVGVQDIWLEFRDAYNQNVKITGYPTEKNPDLLRRIIAASSNPGDLILDGFAGSGTSLAIADEMQRNWIGVDHSIEAFKTILNRFEHGIKPMGDFVKSSGSNSEEVYIQPTLFDQGASDQLDNRAKRLDNQDTKITDFSIFVPSSIPAQIEDIVKTWQGNG